MIVIGLGSGRSGTASLAHLLNSQRNALCFHELNPSCMRFHGTVQPVLNTINEFQAILNGGDTSRLTADLSRPVSVKAYDRLCDMKTVELIGDIGFYYLSYVEEIIAINRDVRFVCLKREKSETVRSWIKKTRIDRWTSKVVADRLATAITRTPYFHEYNHWADHDGTRWKVDLVWDKCFPNFDAPSKQEAIEHYWDYYYAEAEKLVEKYPAQFRIYDIERLNAPDGQKVVLDFCGLPDADHVYGDAHIHAARQAS